ncbi:TolB family protein [Allohahella sp. A8]|uniref:TolB family protein n=1 Tax=Allohahella sp. A8 TaxID=3141461 RepID=UPI003A807E66
MKLTICTLLAGIAAATAVQASDTRVFGERIMLPDEGSFYIGRISADGSAILGNSSADYLIPDDLNGTESDTFFHDTVTGKYYLASLDEAGAQSRSFMPVGLSFDGSIALMSDAYNAHRTAIFRRDDQSVEHLPFNLAKAISGNGRIIGYLDRFEGAYYIGLHDLESGAAQRLPFMVGRSTEISLSFDGNYVAFNTASRLAPNEGEGSGLDVYRYEVSSGRIDRVPFPIHSDAKMGNLSGDGNLVTYSSQSAGVSGGWLYNFGTDSAQKFCPSASHTVVSDNGEFFGCDKDRSTVVIKHLPSGKQHEKTFPASTFFALGGISNTGTSVWGSTQPGTSYDTNGKQDLFITNFTR